MPSVASSSSSSSNGSGNPTTTTHDSISSIANVSIVNDPTLSQFDVLEVSADLYSELFPTKPDHAAGPRTDDFILVKLLGSPDFFNKFKIMRVTQVVQKQTHSITLVNNSNLVRFNNDALTLNKAVVKSINLTDVPQLLQIFVSVPNEIYRLLHDKSQLAIKEKFLTQFLEPCGGVVNEGDYIRFINAKVNLCEPVTQGRVDLDTEIVLINQNDEEKDGDEDEEEEEDYEIEDTEESDLDLSSYLTSSLLFGKYATKLESSTKFSVGPLPERFILDDLPASWAKDDSELFVFMSNDDFIRLGFPIFNGDLVKLNTGSETVVVRVFTFTEPQSTFKVGTVYLSPILLVNLGLTQDSKVQFEPVVDKPNETLSSIIPIAESVTISRVSSQITMDKTYQTNFFSSLKTILSNKLKCVKPGDYFPVVIDTVLAKTMFDNLNDDTNDNDDTPGAASDNSDVIPIGNPDAVAWFKIAEVKGVNEIGTNQFLIDPSKTMLVSSGVESIRLPKNSFVKWYQYLGLPPLFNYEDGNFKYAQEFKKTLSTCLASKINLKTSILLTSMSRGIGKTTLVRDACIEMGLNLIELDCFDLLNPGQELKTIGLLSGKIDKLIANVPNTNAFHVIYLKHIENLCPKTDENDQNSSIFTSLTLKIIQTLHDYLKNYSNLVIVMSCNDYDKLNDNLKSIIKFTIEFTVPTENERLEIFRFLINNEKLKSNGEPTKDINSYPFIIRKDINFKNLALQSAGLTPRDLISIIKKSKKLAIKRLTKLSKDSNISLSNILDIGNGGVINWTPEDFNSAINEARNQFSDSIGAPRIPNVKWEDIGGLDLVKDEILDTIDMPLKHPELFNNGLKKRSGILFYGPPGTGKTLLAKAIATNFSLNFFSVKGPELLNMYIGESEANVRRVFQRARDAKPCVIFFDELDSVAPKRGNQGDSGGVMDRIVSQLLAELDGMSSEGGDGVFVVGATNRPDLLDEALLRPGRFDKMLYLGISDTDEKQTKILEALTRKFKLDDDVQLEEIAQKCSFTFTGADFYALCSDSMLNAMTRVANEVDDKIKTYNRNLVEQGKEEVNTRWWFDNVATEKDITVLVKMVDFIKAQNELIPSVSAEELQHYLRVRENFEGGKEKAKQDLVNGNGH
ncbi:Peroxisomal biogenesis factor 6 [Candida viswanathii]|uniref:Peroxisomal ATPase PEX6 n=1 Tax=Candida viswanathii TaxID=5486 RepID=A0A367YQB1_9ASCO|nr:Peroxisomal biogenesis factor 6 [Candida viswanathii]